MLEKQNLYSNGHWTATASLQKMHINVAPFKLVDSLKFCFKACHIHPFLHDNDID